MLLVYIIRHTSLIRHKMCFKLTQKALPKRTAEVRLFINNYKQANCLLSLSCFGSQLYTNFQSRATNPTNLPLESFPNANLRFCIPLTSDNWSFSVPRMLCSTNLKESTAVMNLSINHLNVKWQWCGSALQKYIQGLTNGSSCVIISQCVEGAISHTHNAEIRGRFLPLSIMYFLARRRSITLIGYLMSFKYSCDLKEAQVHLFRKNESGWASEIILEVLRVMVNILKAP